VQAQASPGPGSPCSCRQGPRRCYAGQAEQTKHSSAHGRPQAQGRAPPVRSLRREAGAQQPAAQGQCEGSSGPCSSRPPPLGGHRVVGRQGQFGDQAEGTRQLPVNSRIRSDQIRAHILDHFPGRPLVPRPHRFRKSGRCRISLIAHTEVAMAEPPGQAAGHQGPPDRAGPEPCRPHCPGPSRSASTARGSRAFPAAGAACVPASDVTSVKVHRRRGRG